MTGSPGGGSPVTPDGRDDYLAWKGWDPASFGVVDRRQGRYFAWHVRRALGPSPGRSVIDVLELGYGNGSFLAWCAAQGHRVRGVELNPNLVTTARSRGFEAHASIADLAPEARFDLIAGFDVLEHVPDADLPGLLSLLASRLKPGGALLLRFPNGDSPFGRANQHGDLTHVTTLGTAKVEQLCTRCDLVLAARGEAPWLAIHPGKPVRGLLRVALRWCLEKLLKFLYTERRLSLDPNMVVVLRAARRT